MKTQDMERVGTISRLLTINKRTLIHRCAPSARYNQRPKLS